MSLPEDDLKKNLFEAQKPQTVEERIQEEVKKEAKQEVKSKSRRKFLGLLGLGAAAVGAYAIFGSNPFSNSSKNSYSPVSQIPAVGEKIWDDPLVDGNVARIEKKETPEKGYYGSYEADLKFKNYNYGIETIRTNEASENPSYRLLRESSKYMFEFSMSFATSVILVPDPQVIGKIKFDYVASGNPSLYRGYKSLEAEPEIITAPGDDILKTGLLTGHALLFAAPNPLSEKYLAGLGYDKRLLSRIKISNLSKA